MEVGAWLRGLGLGQYEAAFRENAIDAAVLRRLTADDLKEIGVAALGHRKRILEVIGTLHEDARGDWPLISAVAGRRREAERRQLTVLFADLAGSTALSTRFDPEEMHSLLKAYQNAVAGEVARFDGHVAKFMGDGVLAYFGWPSAHEDDAHRAVRAALAVAAAVGRLRAPAGEPLACRVGIATGVVVVGDLVGEGAAQEEAVAGETPNLAARLQQTAVPGTVVVGEATRRLLGGVFALEAFEPPELKGFAGPTQAFRVIGEAAAAGRPKARWAAETGFAAGPEPLVGREQELALILGRWALAREGEGQVVLLLGEAGIGKSRIAVSVRDALREQGVTSLTYHGSPYHTGTALRPVTEQIGRAAGFVLGEDGARQLDKVEALVERAGQDPRAAVPVLAELLGIDAGLRYPSLDLTPPVLRARTLEILLDHLAGLADRGPLLVTLEDAHWLDPTTRELFDRAIERIQDLPVLLLATARPEFPSHWASFPHATLVTLNRLGARQICGIVEGLCNGKTLPAELREQILARADGVPLFAEELTRAVLETGALHETAGGFVLNGPMPPLAVPATLHGTLMARLDRLNPVKELAQAAACIGRAFDAELLAAASGIDTVEVRGGLDRLTAAGLVHPRGGARSGGEGVRAEGFAFRHALLQQLARESLLRSRRREVHGRIAEALEALRPEAAEREPEVLAYHYAEAGRPDRAAWFRLQAGRIAKSRHATREATIHLEACLNLAEAAGLAEDAAMRTLRRDAWTMLGDLASLADDVEGANAHYEAALALVDGEVEQRIVLAKRHRPGFAIAPDGARIAFYEHGSDGPAIVFVNPIVYGLAAFQPILEQLCQEFRVITVDCRGAGRSDPLVRPFGIERHAEDLRAVIEAAGVAPVVGVGISRGSNQLVHLAYRHPGLVAGLMLVGTPVDYAKRDQPNSFFNPEYARRRAEAYARGDLGALAALQAEFVYSEPWAGELRRIAVERCLHLPPDTLLSFYDPDPGMDIMPMLPALTIPTLVAHGREDRLNAFGASEFIAARLPAARLHPFEGKGHNPMFSATEEFCEVLRRFVRSVGTAAAESGAAPYPRDATEARAQGRAQ